MEHQIPEIVGAEEVQRGYPPRPAEIPHSLWAFYQGLLLGVRLRAVCEAESSPTG